MSFPKAWQDEPRAKALWPLFVEFGGFTDDKMRDWVSRLEAHDPALVDIAVKAILKDPSVRHLPRIADIQARMPGSYGDCAIDLRKEIVWGMDGSYVGDPESLRSISQARRRSICRYILDFHGEAITQKGRLPALELARLFDADLVAETLQKPLLEVRT